MGNIYYEIQIPLQILQKQLEFLLQILIPINSLMNISGYISKFT